MSREITDKQFSDKTVAKGLEGALGDVADRLNNVRPKDEASVWIPQTVSGGFQPRVWNWQPDLPSPARPRDNPFLPPSPALSPAEETRVKGTDSWGLDIDTSVGQQVVYTIPFRHREPVILTDVDLTLYCDDDGTYFPADWTWDVLGPGPLDVGDYVEDVYMQVQVEMPYAERDPSQDAVVTKLGEFSVDAQVVSPRTGGWSGSDMQPAISGYRLSGLHLQVEHLNVPIPANASVRLMIVIPIYTNTDASDGTSLTRGNVRWLRDDGAGNTLSSSWAMQAYSWSMTYLAPKYKTKATGTGGGR